MFIALAPVLRQELDAAIVCELTGEDLFLSQLIEPYRSQAQAIMRQRVSDVTSFVATSEHYANEMAAYLSIDRSRIAVVHPGVPSEYITANVPAPPTNRPPTVGYVARICPEKGFGQLVEAIKQLRKTSGLNDAKLRAGGYLGGADRRWFDDIMRTAEGVEYIGELDRQSKLDLLDSVDVVSVPSVYAEAKGIYVLEAMARGVPVVQPAHGSFPELVRLTGGGTLVPPNDANALAIELATLLRDPARRADLGRAGHHAVRDRFTNDHMARKMLDVYTKSL
jgi:glycosyltransferase involved in cell wall biosynthesis